MTTLNLQVGAGANDAYSASAGFSATAAFVIVGNSSASLDGIFRFTGVTIPQGSVINSATMEIEAYRADSGSCPVLFRAIAQDNATMPTSYADAESRPKTTVSVAWSMPNFASSGRHTSPDISTPIQEVVDRGGWASGNALVMMLMDNAASDDRWIDSYEQSTANAARLDIDYTEPPEPTLETATFDASLATSESDSLTFDAALQATLTDVTTFDAELADRLTETVSFDAALAERTLETLSFDVMLYGEQADDVDWDAELADRLTDTATFDATLADELAEDLTFDAMLQATLTDVTTFDAELADRLTETVSFDAALAARLLQTFTLDAALAALTVDSVGWDAWVVQVVTEAAAFDAELADRLTDDVDWDATLADALAETATFDAALVLEGSTTASFDAVLVQLTDYKAGLVYSKQDGNNYFAVYLDVADELVRLVKVTSGTPAEVGSAYWYALDTAEVRVMRQGDRHRVYVDFVLLIDEEVSGFAGETKAGLYANDAQGVAFDDFYAEGL